MRCLRRALTYHVPLRIALPWIVAGILLPLVLGLLIDDLAWGLRTSALCVGIAVVCLLLRYRTARRTSRDTTPNAGRER